MDARTVTRTDARTDAWTVTRTDTRMDVRTDARTDVGTNAGTNAWTDARTPGRTHEPIFFVKTRFYEVSSTLFSILVPFIYTFSFGAFNLLAFIDNCFSVCVHLMDVKELLPY